jgi:hypothetical protein
MAIFCFLFFCFLRGRDAFLTACRVPTSGPRPIVTNAHLSGREGDTPIALSGGAKPAEARNVSPEGLEGWHLLQGAPPVSADAAGPGSINRQLQAGQKLG